jgi:hypothetical protein
MVNNSDIQKFLVQSLLTYASSVDLLTDNLEIREDNWHGKEYSYPNVRVKVLSQEVSDDYCTYTVAFAEVVVFSEEPSSDECNDIAFILADYLHHKTISDSVVTNDSIRKISVSVSNLGGAESVGEIWQVRIQIKLKITAK